MQGFLRPVSGFAEMNHILTLPETKQFRPIPKGKDRLPTIHFQVQTLNSLLVSGRVKDLRFLKQLEVEATLHGSVFTPFRPASSRTSLVGWDSLDSPWAIFHRVGWKRSIQEVLKPTFRTGKEKRSDDFCTDLTQHLE